MPIPERKPEEDQSDFLSRCMSDETLNKLYRVIKFLVSKKAEKISGKLISSKWDNIEKWKRKKIEKFCKSELYTIRRLQ